MPTKSPTFNTMTSSETNEWYTPFEITDRARRVMGSIDLDPASCMLANEWIKADKIFTKSDDGVQQDWCRDDGKPSNVWVNPPYGQRSKAKGIYGAGVWFDKLLAEYQAGRVKQAIALGRGDSEGIKRLVRNFVFCDCDRIAFVDCRGVAQGNPPPGTRIFYLGDYVNLFINEFADMGTILARYPQ